MLDTALSLLMLTMIALTAGALFLWRRSGLSRQVVLMLVLAAIMAGNLAIWLVPDGSGTAMTGQVPR